MFPVGIDVSKNTLDLCMLYDGNRNLLYLPSAHLGIQTSF